MPFKFNKGMTRKEKAKMFKTVSIVTCVTIVSVYLLLVTLIYPHVCWIKHRPTDDDSYMLPLTDVIIKKTPAKLCKANHQLSLMPMPLKVIFSNETNYTRIPLEIRVEMKHPILLPTIKSINNASFILSISYPDGLSELSYPDLGIDESYELNVTSTKHASLYAKTYAGIIRGFSTFEQLQHQKRVPVPLTIIDKPQFVWRGLMVDVARHFIPMSILKQTVKFMQLVKMNVLHLHLSDDQGFRLESKTFPKLHTPHEFYSQLEMQDLVEYARQRAIRIVPEFDMPAHTTSWFVGYPHLASSQKDVYQLEKFWGVRNATMDVSRQSTYDFIDQFFLEMTSLFPDKYFHIGGDECQPHEWTQSKHIQAFSNEHRFYDHITLQAYFTRRIEKLLKKYNRIMMGWDEISTANLSTQSVIHSWRGSYSLIEAVQRGHRTVLSFGFYLDHMSSAGYHYENDLHFYRILNKIEQERVLGGEACLWTEYIDANMAHSRTWPRTAAIAERLWSSSYDTIPCMYDRLALMDKNFFHPTDDQYVKDLSRLASRVTELKILADLCEPLGLHARDHTRDYTTQTPLNRLVDVIKPESEQVRQLINMENASLLYSTFVLWKTNALHIDSNATEILQLAENLVRLSELGTGFLKILGTTQPRPIVPSRWYYYQLSFLRRLEYQVPEIRLAGVRVLQDLLEQFDPCSFDVINLSLILCFPVIVILTHRYVSIRRRILLPSLNVFYTTCGRC